MALCPRALSLSRSVRILFLSVCLSVWSCLSDPVCLHSVAWAVCSLGYMENDGGKLGDRVIDECG